MRGERKGAVSCTPLTSMTAGRGGCRPPRPAQLADGNLPRMDGNPGGKGNAFPTLSPLPTGIQAHPIMPNTGTGRAPRQHAGKTPP